MKSKDQVMLEAVYQNFIIENRKIESDPFKEAIASVNDLLQYKLSDVDKQKVRQIVLDLTRISDSPEAKTDVKRSEHFFQRAQKYNS